MRANRICVPAFALLPLIAGCQSHIPPLETAPEGAGPTVTQFVDHIQCELASIVNSATPKKSADGTVPKPDDGNARLMKRFDAAGADGARKLRERLNQLTKYNFVASVQATLDVTDNQGLAPTLAFIRSDLLRTIGLGGTFSDTEDRNMTVNYAVDLAALKDVKPGDYRTRFCNLADSKPGPVTSIDAGDSIAGDLGLADIVVDGLTGLNEASRYNVYSSAPAPIAVSRAISMISAPIALPAGLSATQLTSQGGFPVSNPVGVSVSNSMLISPMLAAFLYSPQAIGSSTQGTVSLNGSMSLSASAMISYYDPNNIDRPVAAAFDVHQNYLANGLTGSIIPSTSKLVSGSAVQFTVSGNLTPVPPDHPLALPGGPFLKPGQPINRADTSFAIFSQLLQSSPAINLVGNVRVGEIVEIKRTDEGGDADEYDAYNTTNLCYDFGSMTISGFIVPGSAGGSAVGGTAQLPTTFIANSTLSESGKSDRFCLVLNPGQWASARDQALKDATPAGGKPVTTLTKDQVKQKLRDIADDNAKHGDKVVAQALDEEKQLTSAPPEAAPSSRFTEQVLGLAQAPAALTKKPKPSSTPMGSGTSSATSSPSGSSKASGTTPSAGGGGTSFGSVINFTLEFGVNGGPTWTLKTFTGPGATDLTLTRTFTDSLAVTFVAACQDFDNVPPATTATSYWDTIPACDQFGTLAAQQFGFQNNNTMIINKLGFGRIAQ